MPQLLFIGLIIALLFWFFLGRGNKAAPTEKWKRSTFVKHLKGVPEEEWKHVLRISRGDQAQALRMVQAEKKRFPNISDREACQKVVKRYMRDNR